MTFWLVLVGFQVSLSLCWRLDFACRTCVYTLYYLFVKAAEQKNSFRYVKYIPIAYVGYKSYVD